jgi:hypothetical protein
MSSHRLVLVLALVLLVIFAVLVFRSTIPAYVPLNQHKDC